MGAARQIREADRRGALGELDAVERAPELALLALRDAERDLAGSEVDPSVGPPTRETIGGVRSIFQT